MNVTLAEKKMVLHKLKSNINLIFFTPSLKQKFHSTSSSAFSIMNINKIQIDLVDGKL